MRTNNGTNEVYMKEPVHPLTERELDEIIKTLPSSRDRVRMMVHLSVTRGWGETPLPPRKEYQVSPPKKVGNEEDVVRCVVDWLRRTYSGDTVRAKAVQKAADLIESRAFVEGGVPSTQEEEPTIEHTNLASEVEVDPRTGQGKTIVEALPDEDTAPKISIYDSSGPWVVADVSGKIYSRHPSREKARQARLYIPHEGVAVRRSPVVAPVEITPHVVVSPPHVVVETYNVDPAHAWLIKRVSDGVPIASAPTRDAARKIRNLQSQPCLVVRV
jgi:hypothetical protein